MGHTDPEKQNRLTNIRIHEVRLSKDELLDLLEKDNYVVGIYIISANVDIQIRKLKEEV